MTDENLKASLDAEIEQQAIRKLADMVREFYKDPANRQAYQEWLKSENAKKYLDYINS